MQIMVCTDTETLAGLRAVVALVTSIITARDTAMVISPDGKSATEMQREAFQAEAHHANVGEHGLPLGYVNPGQFPDEPLDPARAFGVPAGTLGVGVNNVLPFPQPTPQIAVAMAPAVSILAPSAVMDAANTLPIPLADMGTGADSVDAAERDSAGIPWDARIHSDTHKRNAGGSWRFRRNLDEAVKAAVLGELRGLNPPTAGIPAPPSSLNVPSATMPLPPPPPATPAGVEQLAPLAPAPPEMVIPPSSPAVHVPAPPALGVPVPPNASVVPPPVNAVPLPPPPAASAPNGLTASPPPSGDSQAAFRALMKAINKGLSASKFTHPQVVEACKSAGLDGITGLATTPAAVPIVAELLKV